MNAICYKFRTPLYVAIPSGISKHLSISSKSHRGPKLTHADSTKTVRGYEIRTSWNSPEVGHPSQIRTSASKGLVRSLQGASTVLARYFTVEHPLNTRASRVRTRCRHTADNVTPCHTKKRFSNAANVTGGCHD